MPTIVRSSGGGNDVSDANAIASQVLSGATFYSNASEEKQTGTMANKGAVVKTAPYTDGAGYYSSITVNTTGNATNAQVLSGKTFMNASGAQTGAMANKGTVNTSVSVGGSYTNDSGYYSSITIKGPSLSGNATASQVLTGQTFYSNNGTIQTGNMPNKGTVNTSVGIGGSYTNSAGYYSSITIKGPTLSGNATVNDVLSTKTFYASNGTKQTGNMANRGAATCTSLAAGSTYTGSAGYYSSINITAASVSLSGTATNDKVVCGYTYYNTSTTKQTGTMKLWTCSGAIIKGSWTVIDIGFVPTYFGVGFNENSNKNHRLKAYKVGSVLHWCFNGTGTLDGYALAIG